MPITMNLSNERKHNMKSIITTISLALTLVTPAFASIDWDFGSDHTSVAASGGAGTATITPAAFGTGWHSGTAVPWTLTGATGFWDLGKAGSIVLSGVAGSGLTTLNVLQWVQTGGAANTDPYNGRLAVTVGGTGLSLGTAVLVGSLTQGAGWYEYTYNLGRALTSADTVLITASAGGAIIDRVELAAVPEPSTVIAGALMLIPFGLSTWPILRRMRKSKS